MTFTRRRLIQLAGGAAVASTLPQSVHDEIDKWGTVIKASHTRLVE